MVARLLSVDYSDDWEYLEGIEDLGMEFSSSRVSRFTPPSSGIKAKRASPIHSEVIVAAATIGYDTTDMVFVVFSATLNSGRIEPMPGDVLIGYDTRWIIKSVKHLVDSSQWRCYCKRTVSDNFERVGDYLRPGGVFTYLRPDGSSTYFRI